MNRLRMSLIMLQIASILEEAWAPEYTYIGIIVDMDSIRKLQVVLFSGISLTSSENSHSSR